MAGLEDNARLGQHAWRPRSEDPKRGGARSPAVFVRQPPSQRSHDLIVRLPAACDGAILDRGDPGIRSERLLLSVHRSDRIALGLMPRNSPVGDAYSRAIVKAFR